MCTYVCLCVCVLSLYINISIHSSVDGQLVYFYSLAIVNRDAMNNEVHISFQISVSFFSLYITSMELLDHMVIQFSVF